IFFSQSELITVVDHRQRSNVTEKLACTCINNTSVMMFRKGSFEIASTVYPVAIKYDPRFGEAFWNSSKFGMVNYLLRMMSSWAIVCSVWYLPPMSRQEGEDAVQFANRVKAAIARQGGLVDLLW
uniref:Glycerol-3-phosphate acyltransferase 4-like n=2 Tax=Sinocyclocheilus grahami TaxID=75366 RepID=A0A672K240_SINGR